MLNNIREYFSIIKFYIILFYFEKEEIAIKRGKSTLLSLRLLKSVSSEIFTNVDYRKIIY